MTASKEKEAPEPLDLREAIQDIHSLVECAWFAAGNVGHTTREMAGAMQVTLGVVMERLDALDEEIAARKS